ncbi:hypothetical protein GCM10011354_21360 [Egicoccus halophilus]|uniref:Uncharacterized protein n=1 Tax=Egicoccus halophilus TaxID=1670830 RepID=A0A8J3A8S9_9ACTN|nr:hypothetical protein [Egicoccus halophilus]GGI06891.1 hypothetical protein GCM10011354_21360 [Egicoccus halophilus]
MVPPDPTALRVVLAAPMAARGLLDAASDVVDRGVGELDDVEAVRDQPGVVEPDLRVGGRGAVAGVRVERHGGDLGPPDRILLLEPAVTAAAWRPSTTSITR